MASYTNKLIYSIDREMLENTINIFSIRVKDEKIKYVDFYKYLRKYKEDISAILVKREQGCIYCHIMTRNKELSMNKIKDCLPDELKVNIYNFFNQVYSDTVLFNLLLLCISHDSKLCDPLSLSNSEVYEILEEIKDKDDNFRGIKSLKISVKEISSEIDTSSNLFLCADVATFSLFSALPASVKEKVNENPVFFKRNGMYMERLPDRPEDTSNLFVKRNPWTKSEVNSLVYDIDENDKLKTLRRIKNKIEALPFVKFFSFSEILFQTPIDEKILVKQYSNLVEKYKNFFLENTLNIVYENKIDIPRPRDSFLSKVKTRYMISPSEGFNLVILDNSIRGISTKDDAKYDSDYAAELICQHISIDNFKDKNAITKCIQELIVNKDLKDRKISFFDWSIYCGKNEIYKFYNIIKEKDKENNHIYYYGMLEIDLSGKILRTRFEESTAIDEDDEDFSKVFYTLKDPYILGIVEDSSGNLLYFKNTDEFIVVDNDKFFDELKMISKSKKINYSGECWCKMLLDLANEDPKRRELIDRVVKRIKEKDLFDLECVSLEKIKKIIGEKDNDEKEKNKDEKRKKIVYSKARLKKDLENILKSKEDFDVIIIEKLKDAAHSREYYETFKGLHYNPEEHKYTVCAEPSKISKTLTNNVLLKEFHSEREGFFEELIPMFFVPFVYSNRMTVIPFPFKYLREFMKREIKMSKLTLKPRSETSSD